jgi:polyisoprenoid-binding protein YceI
MKKTLLLLFAILLTGVLGATPAAAATAWQIDPPHCAVTFTIQHILAKVPGRFGQFTGDIRFDPQDLAGSSIDVTIQVGSIDTGVQQRDQHLLSADFFDAKTYPTMRFVSQSIRKTGENRYTAQGTLTIKKTSQKIELPFSFLGIKGNPMDAKVRVSGFEAVYTLDRLTYGVGDGKFFKMGAVGREVSVAIYLELLAPK